MCNALYLAAATAPPLVEWHDGASFVVARLRDSEARMVERFTLPHVVSLGAYSGCSCGFDHAENADPDEKASSRASQAALIDYVGELLKTESRVELLMTYYAGDGRPPERTLRWDLDALRSAGTFEMEEGDLVVVSGGPG